MVIYMSKKVITIRCTKEQKRILKNVILEKNLTGEEVVEHILRVIRYYDFSSYKTLGETTISFRTNRDKEYREIYNKRKSQIDINGTSVINALLFEIF